MSDNYKQPKLQSSPRFQPEPQDNMISVNRLSRDESLGKTNALLMLSYDDAQVRGNDLVISFLPSAMAFHKENPRAADQQARQIDAELRTIFAKHRLHVQPEVYYALFQQQNTKDLSLQISYQLKAGEEKAVAAVIKDLNDIEQRGVNLLGDDRVRSDVPYVQRNMYRVAQQARSER